MKQRSLGIDSMRFVACVAVILLHCFPTTGLLKTLVDQTARFAVPFFFITSGHFLAAKLQRSDTPRVYLSYMQKIVGLYLAWSLIYFLDPPLRGNWGVVYQGRWEAFVQQPWEELWFVGISGHFWFFISLTLTVLVFMVFRLRYRFAFLVVAAGLYLVGVLGGAYTSTPVGLDLGINTRNFIFFSALPFAVGVILRTQSLRFTMREALLITLVGWVGHFGEAGLLQTFFATELQDYGFSTVLMGIGVFLLAQQDIAALTTDRLAQLGKLTLGVYAIHILVAQRLHVLYVAPLTEAWFVVWPLLVLAFSLLLTLFFQRVRGLRAIV